MNLLVFLLKILFLLFPLSSFAHDFEDLKEGEEKLYGSKKREKYRSTAFFWEIEDWQDHYSETIFWVYNYTNYPKYKSTYLFPFYSKMESKIDNRKKERFLNYSVFKKDSELEKSFFPFAFWGSDNLEKIDYFTLLPLFHLSFQNKSTKQGFRLVVPLVYYEHQEEKQELEQSQFLLFPFYNKKYEKSLQSEFTSYSLPILPLIYYSTENSKKHLNLFWILDNEWENETLSKSFFLPVYYYTSENEPKSSYFFSLLFYRDKSEHFHYQHYFSSLYTWQTPSSRGWNFLGIVHSHRDENNLKTNYIFPVYYYSENDRFVSLFYSRFFSNGIKEKYGFGPMYSFWDDSESKGLWIFNFFTKQTKDNQTQSLIFFPFFDYEKNYSFSSFSIFYLYSNKSDGKKNFYSRIFPFYSYQEDENFFEYNFLLGVVNRRYSSSKELLSSYFFPFYSYEKSTTSSNYSGFLGLYGKDLDTKGELLHSRFLPFYYYNKNELLYFFPYFRKGSDDLSNEYFRTFFPIYYAWKTKESESNNLLPIWIDYKNIYGDEFKINILAIAKTQKSGLLRPDLNVGNKEDRYYLDTDISWFHSLFRFSTRISAKNPFYNLPKEFYEQNKEDVNQTTNPSLQKKKTFTREDSNFFVGYSALFYFVAYEKADSKRHFRTFPLMWFTWDENSDNKLVLFPPILPITFYYNTPELQYIAFIPFFGRQKTPESKIDSILFFAYIGEEYKEKNLIETSFIWPIFNRYKSDEESGFRVFPLFWDKWKEDKNLTTHKNFSLLHYFETKTSTDDLDFTFLTFPIYYNSYKSKNRNYFTYFFPIFYYFKDIYKNLEYKRNESKVTTWSFLHYYKEELIYNDDKKKEGEKFWITPIWIGFQTYFNSENPVEESHLYPLLYTLRNQESKYWNFSFLFRLNRSEKETKLAVGPFWDFLGYESLANQKLEDSKIWFFPIFYRYKEELNEPNEVKTYTSLNYFFPFIFHNTAKTTKNSQVISETDTFFTLVYSYDEVNYLSGTTSQTRFIPFPLMLYTTKVQNEQTWRIFLFISSKKNAQEKLKEFSIWPIIPVFYDYSSPSMSHTNVLGVLYDFKKEENYKRFYLFPYWESKQEKDLSYRHIIPLYFSSYNEKEHNFFFLGLYSSQKEFSSYLNFLFLGIYEKGKQQNFHDLSFLFGSIQFYSSVNTFKTKILYGLLYDMKISKESVAYELLWMYYRKNLNEIDINFFPIFGIESREKDFHLSLYPILTFYDDNVEYRKSILGFGSIYYNKTYKKREENYTSVLATLLYEHEVYYNPSGRVEERNFLPFGFLYHKTQIQGKEISEDESVFWGVVYIRERKPENDYYRYGSLWGWIWQYEYEEKTDYRKFSILKLFSMETYKGKTRFMGIPID